MWCASTTPSQPETVTLTHPSGEDVTDNKPLGFGTSIGGAKLGDVKHLTGPKEGA
jgi:hypothetical protein